MKKITRISVVAALATSLFVTAPLTGTEASATTTDKKVISTTTQKKITSVAKKLGSNISISVRDQKTGKVVYGYKSGTARSTASNMKILTANAALETLGANYKYKTTIYTTGKIDKKGVLHGDVYLKGQGDPTLHKADLVTFAKKLKAAGITKITGTIYGDDTFFDRNYLAPGISKTDSLTYYGAPVSAITISPNGDYDTGTVLVTVKGSKSGKAPTVTLNAKGHLKVINKAKTSTKSGALSISRPYGSNEIHITGTIKKGIAQKKWLSVDNPTKYTMTTFVNILKQQKITLTNRTYKLKKVPNTAKVFYTDQSPKLSTILIPFMKLSNNGIADTLVKTMGQKVYKSGSNTNGVKVLKAYAKSNGIGTSDWLIVDGSGLSHGDKVAPIHMTKFLYTLQKKAYYNDFLTSLPVGGASDRTIGGTLRNRFTSTDMKNRIFAKTGSINGVRSLSGYAKQKDGDEVVFSILTSNVYNTAIIDEAMKVIVNEK